MKEQLQSFMSYLLAANQFTTAVKIKQQLRPQPLIYNFTAVPRLEADQAELVRENKLGLE